LEEAFEREVVVPFVEAYLSGFTPIPCIQCNTFLKFDRLLAKAQQLGAGAVATGHYARIQLNPSNGRYELLRGRDQAKDQSYFLFELKQEQLQHIRFPLGSSTKREIREMAAHFGLPVSEKPESQEICFIPHNDYSDFVKEYLSSHPEATAKKKIPGRGEIVDSTGQVLGEHDGFFQFTVGQRRGLGIAAGHPLYVLQTDPIANQVIVGDGQELFKKQLAAVNLNWIAIDGLKGSMRVAAKIRNRHEAAPGTLFPVSEEEVLLEFDEPQRAITPGQAAVFYVDDLVIGGGWIREGR
jgi:tRNA-specific 2-thiouridylase